MYPILKVGYKKMKKYRRTDLKLSGGIFLIIFSVLLFNIKCLFDLYIKKVH